MSITDRCPDWICSFSSNVHVARDRSWFTSYTRFKTHAMSRDSNLIMAARGIGTVEFKVRTDHARVGPEFERTMVLYNVLHVPTSVCNIFSPRCYAMPSDLTFSYGGLKNRAGEYVSIFDTWERRSFTLVPGQAATRSVFADAEASWIGATWPDSERDRWIAFDERREARAKAKSSNTAAFSPKYTAEERSWLKKHYGNEYKFLRSLGLFIAKENHRDEGRKLARAFMQMDKMNHMRWKSRTLNQVRKRISVEKISTVVRKTRNSRQRKKTGSGSNRRT